MADQPVLIEPDQLYRRALEIFEEMIAAGVMPPPPLMEAVVDLAKKGLVVETMLAAARLDDTRDAFWLAATEQLIGLGFKSERDACKFLDDFESARQAQIKHLPTKKQRAFSGDGESIRKAVGRYKKRRGKPRRDNS